MLLRRMNNYDGQIELFFYFNFLLSWSLSYFDQSQYPTDPENTDDPQECRRHGKIDHDVFHEYAEDGRQYQQEIENVPRHGEVMKPEADYFHQSLCWE